MKVDDRLGTLGVIHIFNTVLAVPGNRRPKGTMSVAFQMLNDRLPRRAVVP